MKKMELSEISSILEWVLRIAILISAIAGILWIIVKQRIKIKESERLQIIEQNISDNNLEDKLYQELKGELILIADSNWENPPKIKNIHIKPTEEELNLLLQFLQEKLPKVSTKPVNGLSNNSINNISISISKLFENSNKRQDFENLISNVVNNETSYEGDSKVRFLHGLQLYFQNNFADKKELMIEIILNTVGLKYEGYPNSPSISWEYFMQFLNQLDDNDSEEFTTYLNNEVFVNKLKQNGVINEFNEIYSPNGTNKNNRAIFLSKIKESYLAKIIEEKK
ncbi:hypothetical protein [Aquimarina sp. 2304DJ70-9]|uniref:hypothetical protein n=1 Tax=Aquimarina penaris TaxID=3231044 RepID=UPI003462A867